MRSRRERRCESPRGAIGVLATLVSLVLAAGEPPAQSPASIVGIHDIEPGLVHPAILAKLRENSRALKTLDLELHESVPMRVWLTPGKRAGEYLIEAEPKVGITRLILPGLINNKLVYGLKRMRQVRFEVFSQRDSLWICNHCGSTAELADHEITFVDLDHDGQLGSITDGFVVKAPKEKYWADPAGRVAFRPMSEPVVVDGRKHWLQVDAGGFTMVVSERAPDFAAQRDVAYTKALAQLNGLRRQLGHAPVELRADLSRACEEHALYCATNGELVHDQDPKKPGASPAGARAAPRSELVFATTMQAGIDSWTSMFFHRIAMLSPAAQRIGMGCIQGVAALDAQSDVASSKYEPWAWPPDQAVDVPVTWPCGEMPSPIGDVEFTNAVAKLWGHPITLAFATGAVADVRARVLAGGEELPVFVSTPEQPSNARFPTNLNSILVMTRSPLPRATKVTVEVSCTYAGKPFAKTWSFTTRG